MVAAGSSAAWAQQAGDLPPSESSPPPDGGGATETAEQKSGSDEEKFELDVGEALAQRGSANAQASSSILTSETTADIMGRAHLTLSDYLLTIPGFTVAQGAWYDFPAARGLAGSVSFLIDGVNYTSPIDYRYPAGLGLFFEEFERINIISGPAGVPWGAYSFLGVINALTGRTTEDATLVRGSFGNRDTQRIALRRDLELGGGALRLFLGYATQRQADRSPNVGIIGVQPYSASTEIVDNAVPIELAPDSHVVVSARYSTPSLVAYLRVPVSNTRYAVSELGGVVSGDDAGKRQVLDAFGFVNLQKSFFGGSVSGVARIVWHGIHDKFLRSLLPDSELIPGGARSLQEITMSQFNAITEAGWRYQSGVISSEAGVGLEGQLTTVHDSTFAVADPALNGELVTQGSVLPAADFSDVLAGDTPISGSAYAFDELRLWDRFSVFGGARLNRGNNFQGNVVLWQANVGARLFGQTYIKGGRTAGMRPPTLLDQIGRNPIVGRTDLVPERSEAIQLEANTAFEVGRWLQKGFFRADFSRTTTENNIVREGQRFSAYEFRPVSTQGFDIDTYESVLSMRLFSMFELYGMVQRNIVRRPKQESEAADLDRTVPNRGYADRAVVRLAVEPHEYVRFQTAATVQCNATRQSLAATPAVITSRPELQDQIVNTKPGCFPLVDAAVRFPAVPSTISLTLAATNLTNEHAASAFFPSTELQGAEPPNLRWSSPRTIWATLEWVPGQTGVW